MTSDSRLNRLRDRIVAALGRPRPGSRRSPSRPEQDVRTPFAITYRPALDGNADPGEVVWVWVPYEEEPRRGKDRPVVIVGELDGGRLAAVVLTSKAHPERTDHFEVGTGPWDSSRRVSYAKLDRVLSLRPDGVRREGAILDRVRFDRLLEALVERSGWPDIEVDVVE